MAIKDELFPAYVLLVDMIVLNVSKVIEFIEAVCVDVKANKDAAKILELQSAANGASVIVAVSCSVLKDSIIPTEKINGNQSDLEVVIERLSSQIDRLVAIMGEGADRKKIPLLPSIEGLIEILKQRN